MEETIDNLVSIIDALHASFFKVVYLMRPISRINTIQNSKSAVLRSLSVIYVPLILFRRCIIAVGRFRWYTHLRIHTLDYIQCFIQYGCDTCSSMICLDIGGVGGYIY